MDKNLLLLPIVIAIALMFSSCLPPPDNGFPPPEENLTPPVASEPFHIVPVSVSASGHDGNVPENTLDGSLSTRWSSEGIGQWIMYDLTKNYDIRWIDIAWHRGDQRITFFDVQYSVDGVQWATAFSGESSGITLEHERYNSEDAGAKYVRIVGYGNNITQWNSITTVMIYGINVTPDTNYLDPTVSDPVCGNAIIEVGEECDDGDLNGVICNPPAGGSCSYCSNECTIITVSGITEPTTGDYQIIELSRHATIHDGPFNIVHDRRASNNLSVNAPWLYETYNGNYNTINPLKFSYEGLNEELSVWIRIYMDRADAKGWKLDLPNGISRTIRSNALQDYAWVEAYRGKIAGTVSASLQPLGPRSRVDVVMITPSRDSSSFDSKLNLTKPGQVPSGNYYVAITGRDTNPGTISSPFRTIQKAIDLAVPGDVILVRGGRYEGFSIARKNGRKDAWITVMAYPGERVIIDPHISSTNHAGIRIDNPSSYWIFDGFEFTDSNPLIDEIRKLNLFEVDEQVYHDMAAQIRTTRAISQNNAATREPNSNLIFRNLEVHGFLRTAIGGHSFYTHYLNNHVYDTNYYGWYAQGTYNIYRGNIVHDTPRPIQAYGYDYNPVRHSVYEENLFFRNGLFPYMHSSGSYKINAQAIVINTPENQNNTVINNIFIYNGNGIQDRSDNGLIANNVFIGNGLKSGTPYAVWITGSGMRVINNYFFDNKRNIRNDGSNSIVRNNLESSTHAYKDPYRLDFTVIDGASTIDTGEQLREVGRDFFGTTRPQGSGWDVGAVER
jgi:hypothetical protein